MPKHSSKLQAPGSEYLPDLALNLPLQRTQIHPDTFDPVSVQVLGHNGKVRSEVGSSTSAYSLGRYRLSHYDAAQVAPTNCSTEEAGRTSRHVACFSVKAKAGAAQGVDIGREAMAPNKHPLSLPDCSGGPCASCSKLSLACVHSAALHILDEYCSKPKERRAVKYDQQPMCLPSGFGELRAGSHCAEYLMQQDEDPPMLRRWLSQSPRQETFNGVATAEFGWTGATKSHL